MKEIVFNVRPAEQGGFCVAAEGIDIYAQGETLEEVRANIREAVAAYLPRENPA